MRNNQIQGSRFKVQTASSCNLAPKGFTLIEVLIAMTLLSIMVVLLFTSLKICADSWEKGESKITDVNEVAVVYNFFQRHLSVAKPLWNDLPAEEKTFSFQGKARSLQFVSAFPASADRSGLQLFSIRMQKEDNEQLVIVTVVPFFPVAEGEEWREEEVTLIKQVSDLKLAYFGADDNGSDGVWQDEWVNKETLPQLVKINIQLENKIYWPEMIIELKVTSTGNDTDLDTQDIQNTQDIEDITEPETEAIQ